MEIKIIGQDTTEVEQLEQRDVSPVEGANDGEINQIAVRQVLEIEKGEYQDELETILEWAKSQTKSDEYTDLKWAIRDLSMRLGTPTHGDRIKHLARFAYLDLEEKRIQKEKSSFR